MEIEGVIKVLKDEQQVSATFKKRELVVSTDETYPQHILIEFNQDKCDILGKCNVGDKVKVSINIRGREYTNKTTGEIKYFNTIQGWKIQSLGSALAPQQAQKAAPIPETEGGQDVPF